jgi:lantibiotic modifying enzyme
LAAEVAQKFAVELDGLANWPALAGGELVPRDGSIRTQWCHGAPGIVASLAGLLDEDLALAGGELVWRAGPLVKGANLCHGTAGNGYAFLALFARTEDEQWLARARAFAMHALSQVELARAKYGRGRHTLWTGDPGTALYLADCLGGNVELPLP